MEDKKIIVPTNGEKLEQMPDEATTREINKWNLAKGNAMGEWVYCKEYGIVWVNKSGDLMGGSPTPPTDPPPSILSELVKWGETLNLEEANKNSVLVIKLSSINPIHAQQMQRSIINMVLAPKAEKLKDKKLTVLFMAAEDDISLLDESDMESAGWQKKEKSLIIDPFKK
jgi:hypothetical protein